MYGLYFWEGSILDIVGQLASACYKMLKEAHSMHGMMGWRKQIQRQSENESEGHDLNYGPAPAKLYGPDSKPELPNGPDTLKCG